MPATASIRMLLRPQALEGSLAAILKPAELPAISPEPPLVRSFRVVDMHPRACGRRISRRLLHFVAAMWASWAVRLCCLHVGVDSGDDRIPHTVHTIDCDL